MAAGLYGGAIYVKLLLDQKGFVRGIANSRRALRGLSTSIKGATLNLHRLGVELSLAGTAGVTFFGSMIKMSVEYNQALRESVMATDFTDAEMHKLDLTVRNLSKTYGEAAEDILAMARQLSFSGKTSEQILKMLPPMTRLARLAVMSDKREIAEGMIAIQNAFGLSAEEISKTVDTLVAGFSMSQQEIEDLTTAMNYAGAPASLFNNTLDDTVVLLSALANAGIRSSRAGVALRRTLANIADTSKPAGRMAKDLLETYDKANGKLQGIIAVLDKLRDVTAHVTEEERNAIISRITGVRSLSGFAKLIQLTADQWEVYKENIKESAGRSKVLLERMAKGAGFQFDRLKQTIIDLRRTIGDTVLVQMYGFLSKLRLITDQTIKYVLANQELIGSLVKAGAEFSIFAVSLGAVCVMLPGVKIGLQALIYPLVKLVTILYGLTVPVTAASAAIIGFVGSLYVLRASINQNKELIQDFWEVFVDSTKWAKKETKPLLSDIADNYKWLINQIIDGFLALPVAMTSSLEMVQEIFYKFMSGDWQGIQEMMSPEYFAERVNKNVEATKSTISNVLKGIYDIHKDAANEISEIIKEVDRITLEIDKKFRPNQGLFQKLGRFATGGLQGLWGNVKDQWSEDISSIEDMLVNTDIGKKIGNIYDEVAKVLDKYRDIWNNPDKYVIPLPEFDETGKGGKKTEQQVDKIALMMQRYKEAVAAAGKLGLDLKLEKLYERNKALQDFIKKFGDEFPRLADKAKRELAEVNKEILNTLSPPEPVTPTFMDGIRDYFKGVKEELGNTNRIAKQTARDIHRAFEDSFEDLFGDMFHNRLKRARSYFEDFGNAILDVLAKIAAKLVVLSAINATLGVGRTPSGGRKKLGWFEMLQMGLGIANTGAGIANAANAASSAASAGTLISDTPAMTNNPIQGVSVMSAMKPATAVTQSQPTEITIINSISPETVAGMLAHDSGKQVVTNIITSDILKNGATRKVIKQAIA